MASDNVRGLYTSRQAHTFLKVELHFLIALQGMTKWENNFIEEDIDLHVFLTLDDEDLKKIGNKKYI